jgi:hypothetical protein
MSDAAPISYSLVFCHLCHPSVGTEMPVHIAHKRHAERKVKYMSETAGTLRYNCRGSHLPHKWGDREDGDGERKRGREQDKLAHGH